MQAVFALVMCAVLNDQIQWDRCTMAPGHEGYFATAEQCWATRSEFAFLFGRYPRERSSHHEFIQWKAPNSGPFNTTATCVQKDAAFRPAP